MPGDCAMCGAPDNVHRVTDVMVGRVIAGEPLHVVVADFELCSPRELWLMVTATLSSQLGMTRSKAKAERIDREWREFLAREGQLYDLPDSQEQEKRIRPEGER